MSEAASSVEHFLDAFKRNTNRELETINPDTRDGAVEAELHDVVEYPTILALMEDGREVARWRGSLPLINEVSYYCGL